MSESNTPEQTTDELKPWPEVEWVERWLPGLPEGELTNEMLETFEAYFSPGGAIWHRRRSEIEIEAYRTMRRANGKT